MRTDQEPTTAYEIVIYRPSCNTLPGLGVFNSKCLDVLTVLKLAKTFETVYDVLFIDEKLEIIAEKFEVSHFLQEQEKKSPIDPAVLLKQCCNALKRSKNVMIKHQRLLRQRIWTIKPMQFLEL